MIIDIVILVLVLIFAVLGYWSGLLRQALRLAALVCAGLLAAPLGALFAPAITRAFEVQPLVGRVAGPLLAFVALYLVLSVAAFVILRGIRRRRRELGRAAVPAWERWTGAVLGALKLAAIAFLLLSGLVLLERFSPGGEKAHAVVRESRLCALARSANLFAALHLPVVGKVESLGKLAADPEFREKAAADPAVQRLLFHPIFRKLLDDPEIQELAKNSDLAGLLGNPRLNQTLEDPEIKKLLSEIELR
ncbi:MAG: CvpA family protein [Myxococcales bacterium]|nr:CvpA family protein [Myxococcales bacterium]